MITTHALPRRTDRQTDGRTSWRYRDDSFNERIVLIIIIIIIIIIIMSTGYKHILRQRLKVSVEHVAVLRFVDRLFQALGTSTENALSPIRR